MKNQVFIVGTGRCGSTLLSEMLRSHPTTVSISEFFAFVTDLGCRVDAAFPPGPVSGEYFWTLLSTPYPRQNLMLQHDVAMDEVLYPWKAPESRFHAHPGVPPLSQVTLPHLSKQPDEVFDAVKNFVLSLRPAPIGDQYQALFGWFSEYTGKQHWVERSGGCLRIMGRLLQHFPEARYVHIVRDGRNTALSMSRHLGFRMVFAAFQMMEMLGVDPFESSSRRWEEDLPDDLASILPERFTREAFLNFETPPPLCGHYWSGEIMDGLRHLEELPPERVLTLRYEDFLENPAEACRRLNDFITQGERHDQWIEEAVALVGRGRSAWQSLDARAKRELEKACAPGLKALEQRGITWR